jgi:hypothetical protein
MKRILLIVAAMVLLLPLALTACSSGGVDQAKYDDAMSQAADAMKQLNDTRANLEKAQADLTKAQADKQAADAGLQAAQGTQADLQKQIDNLTQQLNDLKKQSDTTGATTTEIVTRLVQAYEKSHAYQKDIYDCNNYATDIWDMLQKLNINSVIVIGDIDTGVSDILATTHAWVLVDVGGGQKLAFDGTYGKAFTKAEKPLYYQGWTFATPADLKANDDLRAQYNAGVVFRNTLNNEVNSAMTLYNNSANETEADKYMTLYNKLKALKTAQETALTQLAAQINALATKL